MKSILNRTILIFAATMILCSCKSVKLTYFNDLKDSTSGTLGNSDFVIRIEPFDELIINVTSEVPEATSVYNLPMNDPLMQADLKNATTTPKQQTYIVDKDGDIKFPILGKLHVAGLTTSQLSDNITRLLAADVEAPYVRVELVNFRVYVLGEVSTRGPVKVTSERFSIIDALASAGDITVYGRKDNVLLIREENGQKQYHRLNLNDSKIMESPYYYLKQNDAIIVDATPARQGQAEYNQNNSFKISVASAVISCVSVISSLVIALTR